MTLVKLALVGLLVGVGTYLIALGTDRDRVHAQFGEFLEAQATLIEHEVRTCLESLYAVRALFHASELVTRQEFATFVADAGIRHPAIKALEWAPHIPHDQREAHVRSVQEEGFPGYEIVDCTHDVGMVPAPRREAYAPVCFVEPHAENEGALGFDLAGSAPRRASLQNALESGDAALTDPIHLVQETASSHGILGTLAICDHEAATREERHATLQGFVVLVLRIDDILEEAFPEDLGGPSPRMHFSLTDQDAGGQAVVLHSTARSSEAGSPETWIASQEVEVGGQVWHLAAAPAAGFLAERWSGRPILLGLLTFLFSVGVGWALVQVSHGSRTAMTRKHDQRIRSVLRSLGEGVVVADQSGRIEYINEAAKAMIGTFDASASTTDWTAVYGLHLDDRVTPVPPEDLPLVRAARGEHISDQSLFLRNAQTPSGKWLRVSGAPLLDASDVIQGSVMVMSDVTEKKKAAELTERLSSAVEQTADAVFITKRGGTIIYVNPAFEETTGIPREEALGKTPRILKSGHHDHSYYKSLWGAICKGEVFRSTAVNRKKNGEIFYAEQTITPLKDAQGRVTHFVSVSKDMTEKRRRQEQEAEMRLAAVVQENMYPQEAPKIEGFDIAGVVRPADVTCGDYFDYIDMPCGLLGLAIGDISGHGLGPALLMAETRAYLRSLVLAETAPDALFAVLNQMLINDLEEGRFVTLLFAMIDPESRRLTYTSAGHTPGHVLDRSGAVKAELGHTGPLLGVFEGSHFGVSEPLTLEQGDTILLLTDGITEARSPEGTYFEHEHALEVVRANAEGSAEETMKRLIRAVGEFSGGLPPADDQTMIVCKVV